MSPDANIVNTKAVDTDTTATELRVLGLEPRTHGLKGRCSESVTADDTTTYDDTDPALTDLLTYFSREWPEMDPADRDRVLDLCLGCDDPGLKAVAESWPKLPEAVRAGIVAMVKAATGGVESE